MVEYITKSDTPRNIVSNSFIKSLVDNDIRLYNIISLFRYTAKTAYALIQRFCE